MAVNRYVVGVDFGTLSGRAVVVRVADGAELGVAEHAYAHGVIDQALAGAPLPPDWALQDPGDYREVLKRAVPAAVTSSGVDPAEIIGIAVDTTASTVLPALADGTPLCELGEYRNRPHAYPKLWKHHAAQPHADRINALARDTGQPWLSRYGGTVSAEWQFAKALQFLEEDPELFARADRWIEASDWITWQLCGREVRNVCAAGYKGLRQDGAYPSAEFLAGLASGLPAILGKIDGPLGRLGAAAGRLTEEAASWTGLRPGITVAVGNVDAHVTAPAADALAPGRLLAIMGTSTCHVMNGGDTLAEIPGMCGVVDGGIVAGQWGYEAGQSGVGDIFGWFADLAGSHEALTHAAARQRVGEHGLVALDWHGGNRSLLVDHRLRGALVGLTTATTAAGIYRALVEGTAFGARKIIEAFTSAGLPVDEVIVAGGLLKNPFVMRTYADVLRRPLSVIGSEQGPALGSAIHAAVAAGAYPGVPAAAAAMGRAERAAYRPAKAAADRYDELYAIYSELHDHFGVERPEIMRRLNTIRNEAVTG